MKLTAWKVTVAVTAIIAMIAAGCGGSAGKDGAQGPAGKDGTNGTIGANGKDGAKGADGLAGTNGVKGADGAAGTNGTNGTNGADGAAGANGKDGVSVGQITVSVMGPDGAALADADVTTIPASVAGKTDASGTATLAGVAIGTYAVTANKAGFKADGLSVSVIANGTATATLRLGEGAPFALARVVGIPAAYSDQLPDSKKRTSATKPSTDVRTGALANVAVGSYVYLQAVDADAAGTAITSQTWALTQDLGSKTVLESWDGTTGTTLASGLIDRTWVAATDTAPATAANVRLRPDVAGHYTVTINVVAGATNSSYSLDIFAGTYTGAQQCASCHSNEEVVGKGRDVYPKWTLTGHATKFEKYYASYSATSDYCVQCHTTGYDETTASGFDDAARSSGWDPAVSSMLAWSKAKWATIADFTADPVTEPMQKLMNIQCESCHGPGSQHPEASGHMSWNPAVCGQCHGQQKQWELSKHGVQPAPAEWGSADCMPCHSGQGFVVSKIQNKPIVFPDQSFEGYPATVFEKGEIQPIGCVTCHDPHEGNGQKSAQLRVEETSFTAPMGYTISAKESSVCNMCHVGRRDSQYFQDFLAGKKSRASHRNVQADMLAGKGGYEYAGKTYESSYHTAGVKQECIKCHMYTGTSNACTTNADCTAAEVCSHSKCTDQNYGGHTWAMSFTNSGGTKLEHVTACSQTACHGSGAITAFDRVIPGNLDGDGADRGVQTQINGLLTKLAAKLQWSGAVPESGIDKLNPAATPQQLQALWNYWYVKNDASGGIHNTKYAAHLLCDSLKDLDPTATCNL